MVERADHDWIPSTLGHGDYMCRRCEITNWEAIMLGTLSGPCVLYFPHTLKKAGTLTTGNPEQAQQQAEQSGDPDKPER